MTPPFGHLELAGDAPPAAGAASLPSSGGRTPRPNPRPWLVAAALTIGITTAIGTWAWSEARPLPIPPAPPVAPVEPADEAIPAPAETAPPPPAPSRPSPHRAAPRPAAAPPDTPAIRFTASGKPPADADEALAAHLADADRHASQERWRDAHRAYLAAHALAPTHPDIAFNLAITLDRLGDAVLARHYYRLALEQSARHPPRWQRADLEARLQALEVAP